MIYLTGDTHGDFKRIAHFCARMHTTPSDILIILGDAGINFSGGWRDLHKKEFIISLPITLFCIHGNHEQRPATIPSYTEQEWHGGTVYVEEQFPSILFAKDGEVYELNGMRAIAIGGAYSIDWMLRIPGRSWWPDEQPSDEVKARVEQKLDQLGWQIDVVLSHTVPLKYEPVEVFLPGIAKARSTSLLSAGSTVSRSVYNMVNGMQATIIPRKTSIACRLCSRAMICSTRIDIFVRFFLVFVLGCIAEMGCSVYNICNTLFQQPER